MAESVPVRCPECRREHTYTPPVYPCACGAPVTLPLLHGGLPVRVRHRTWEGSWVEVRCPACDAAEQWPQPELGCGCGAILRLPVTPPRFRPASMPYEEQGDAGGAGGAYETSGACDGDGVDGGYEVNAVDGEGEDGLSPADGTVRQPRQSAERQGTSTGQYGTKEYEGYDGERPSTERQGAERQGTERQGLRGNGPATAGRSRPAFCPVTIRTAQDVRTAAAQYLRWLGFADVRATERNSASGIDLRGSGVVAHVDPTTEPTTPRAVETLWLNGLNESVAAVCFSLAGYARESRVRADRLTVALFVLDLTGTPQPVNDAADELLR